MTASFEIKNGTVFFRGDLVKTTIPALYKDITKPIQKIPQAITIDLAQVTQIDSAGAIFLTRLVNLSERNKQSIQFINTSAPIQDVLNLIRFDFRKVQKFEKTKVGFLEEQGEKLYSQWQSLFTFLILISNTFYWGIIGLLSRKGMRKGSILEQSYLIGYSAIPIVFLLSFIIGLTVSVQSAIQLKQFGANIFIVNLVGIAMTREMGPLITAIIIAGRSGSAIAAEIGTMVVTEEIDALKVMGFNPVKFIVIPKFYALTITQPILTFFSDLIGIFGGFAVAFLYLDLSYIAFFNQFVSVVEVKDFLMGLSKSVVFAWIIAIVGCFKGFTVTGGAEGVGKVTTAAVVSSIFWIIVADAIFSFIYY